MNGVAQSALVAAAWLAAAASTPAAETASLPAVPRPLGYAGQEAAKYPRVIAGSPDGAHVAFVLKDLIHVATLAGSEPRPIPTAGSTAWDPQWSRDGSVLYFLSDRSDTSQVWK